MRKKERFVLGKRTFRSQKSKHFVLRIIHGKLDQEHAFRIVEKTWGKDRLNKDCYKKGAKYEGL